mgnify:CR=1 FL=1
MTLAIANHEMAEQRVPEAFAPDVATQDHDEDDMAEAASAASHAAGDGRRGTR